MVQVVKATGEKELFSEDKLQASINRAGIPNELHQKVVDHVKGHLYEDIPTREIYHHVTEFLAQSAHPYARAKYSLKEAIMEFGPTGFPFEDFVAHIFIEEGYQTITRSIIAGTCIHHEIDIIATKEQNRLKKLIVEVKFHNRIGIKTDAHVALYTKARFDDVKVKNHFDEVWLVTNTKITTDAISYADCVGMKIISWSYPEKQGLRDLVEKYQLHPITALTTLTQLEKQQLLQQGIVLCRDLCKKQPALDALGLPPEKKFHVLKEAAFACDLHRK